MFKMLVFPICGRQWAKLKPTLNTRSVADRSVSVQVTVSYPERRDTKGQKFLADLHNYARTV